MLPVPVCSRNGRGQIYFLKCWSRKKLPGNKVVGYCLEIPNQYFPFQYVPERGVAKIHFLKYWSRKNFSGNKVVGHCLEMADQYSPFQ